MSGHARTAIVVGAGMAGLAAAWRLSRAGFEVSVLERDERPGGRAAGVAREGFALERQIPLVGRCDRDLMRWIEEVGQASALLPVRSVELAQVSGGAVRKVGQPGAFGMPQASGGAVRESRGSRLPRVPGLRAIDTLRALRLPRLLERYAADLDPEVPERAARWDDRSVADFARLYFGRSGLERWLGPVIASLTLDDEREISRVALLLERRGPQGKVGAAGLLCGGLHLLASETARQLGVECGVTAHAVVSGADGRLCVETRESGAARAREADAVVVATGAAEAARLTAGSATLSERDALAEMQTVPALVLSVALDPMSAAHAAVIRVPHVERSPVGVILADPGPGRAPAGSGVVTLAATADFARSHEGAPDDVVAKSLVGALEDLAPALAAGICFHHLARVRMPRFEVGAYRRLSRFAAVQADRRAAGRRLYWAGDHLVGPGAGDAAVAGRRAAEAVVEDLA